MIAQRFSMLGQQTLGRALGAYWPLLWLLPMNMLYIPYAPDRRLDMYPYHDLDKRVRFFTIELMIVVVFLVCSVPANPLGRKTPVMICDDPHGILGMLNRCVLFVYMCHVPFLRMLPEPLNWISVYGCALVFYAEDKALDLLNRPGAPEVFGFSWLILILPFLSLLRGGSLPSVALIGLLGYTVFVMVVNLLSGSSKRKKVKDVQLPGGISPLTAEDYTP
jgi:hypothetical protein